MDIFEQLSAPPHLQAFMTSLAIGLLIGLERERRSSAKAGLRTFALVALLGTLSGLLAEKTGSGWILSAGLLSVGAMIIAAYINRPDDAGDSGTTSVVAILVCFCLGAAVWFGYGTLAVMLGIATTVLLYFKAELHGLVGGAGCHRDRARRAVEPDFQGRVDRHPRQLEAGAAHPAGHAGRRRGHRTVSRMDR